MFGKKAARIQELESENQGLQAQLVELNEDPFYKIGLQIRDEVETMIDGPFAGSVSQAIDQAVTERIESERAKEIDRIAETRSAALIEAERSAIAEEASVAAEEIAVAALAAYRANEAESYRLEVRDRLGRKSAKELIRLAQKQIDAEEERAVVEFLEQQERERREAVGNKKLRREQMKVRAQELREEAKKTEIILVSSLEPGDVLKIAFSKPKDARIDSNNYYGYYQSGKEERHLKLKVIDPDSGACEVEKDSWFGDSRSGYARMSLRGGTQLTVHAPSMKDGPSQPAVVKTEQLLASTSDGSFFENVDNVVWWVDLEKFKIIK